VSTYERYRQYALDCLGLANKTNDLSTKTLLVDMAQAWVKLAEQAAKNAEGGAVYETPTSGALSRENWEKLGRRLR